MARLAGLLLFGAALVSGHAALARPPRPQPAPSALPSNLPPVRPPPPTETTLESRQPEEGAPRRSATSLIPGLSNPLLLGGGGALLVVLLLALLLARSRRPPPRARASRPDRLERADPPARPARRPRPVQAPASLEEPAVDAPALRPEHSLLLGRRGNEPSLYDRMLALGPDPLALRCLREAAAEHLDPLSWAAAIKDGRRERLSRWAQAWGRHLALARAAAWLRDHPLVKESGLELQLPAVPERSELSNLTLTRPDGLGVTLGGEQVALLEQARAALDRAMGEEPFALLAASSALDALLPASLRSELEQGHPRHALALLMSGLPALDWAVQSGLGRPGIGTELREALAEHARLVGTPVPAEGPVAHAVEVLGDRHLEGVGLLLAAAAGAAFSSSTVILRISKRLGEIKAPPLVSAFGRLGALACAALDDEGSPDRAVLLENLRFVLGQSLLDREHKRAAALAKEAERLAAREPLWKEKATAERQSPELALASLHEVEVKLALERAGQAQGRLLELIDRLAHPGAADEEQTLGHRRLGYVLAGLGAPLLRNTSTEILSAGREVLAMTSAMDAVSAPALRARR